MIDEEKTIQEKLLISETKFRRLFEAAQDGILLIDPLTEKIIDANPYLLDMIGYSHEETIGKELWEIGFFKNITATKEVIKELQAKKTVRYEDLPLKSKGGETKEVEFVSNLYPINSVSMIQCNIRNITDRKILEKKAKIYLAGVESLNRLMMGREVKMAELKAEIERLNEELSR